MKKRFTIVDYIIIILIICAVAFAFIHITTDDSTIQKTAFDSATINKIPDTYLNLYKDGLIVTATVNGFNSSTGEEITTNGTVIWADDDGGSDIKILIENENGTYLLGTYRNNPNSDIYIDSITLESNGDKYSNLTEIKIKSKNITSLNDLVSNIPNNTNYEITTKISSDSLTQAKLQEVTNLIASKDNRFAIKPATKDNEIMIVRANNNSIHYGDSILGDFNGVSDEITIRIYDCSDAQLNAIKNKEDVSNIRTFQVV